MDLMTLAIGLVIAAANSGASQGARPFDGNWLCEGIPVEFKDGTYWPVEDAEAPTRITKVAQAGDDFGLTLDGGYLMNLRDFTGSTMTLELPDRRFDCNRM